MIIQVLGQQFSVCKVADYGEVDCCQSFVFTGSTDAEKSLACPMECIPAAPRAHQLPNGVLCLCLLFHGVDYAIFAGCG